MVSFSFFLSRFSQPRPLSKKKKKPQNLSITVVEDLRRKREPLPHLAAVYFISPGGESAAQVAADFGGCVESVADAASSNPPKGGSGGGDGESDDGSGKKKKRFGGLFGRAKRDKTPPASPKQPSQQRPQPPLYASAHVFFSSPPTTRDLELLRSCPGLVSPASNRLKSCADAGMEWLAVDGRCFVTQHPPAALAPLFGPAGADGEAPGARAAVALAGRRLATLFASAGEHPVVRFRAPPPPAPGRSLGSRALLPQRLALEVHAALAAAAAAGAVPATPGGGAGGGRRGAAPRPSLPPPELVIVDRGADTFSVLCQAWGYEAMAADVLGVGAVSPGSSSAGGPGGGGAEATAGAAPATARTSTAGDAADASASASPAPLAPPPAPALPWSSSTYRGTGPAVFEYETESGGSAAAGGAAAPLKSTRAARLDPETDPVFAALRDRHFAFASADVAARLDAFKAAHPESRDPSSANGGGGGGGGGSSLDTRAMRSLAARLPQYRDELSRLAAHVELASRLARAVDARRLLDAGALEQAFGSGKGGSRQLIAALSSSSGSSASTSASNSNPLPPPPPPFPQDVKLRLLLCYAATHPGKLDAAKEMQWAKLARLSPPADLAKCLAGLEALGVPVYKRGGSGSSSASSSSSNQGIPPLLLPGASAAMSAAAAKVLSRGASGVGGGGGGTFGSRVFGGGGGSLLSSPSTAATLAAGDASSASSSASDADYLTGAVPTLVAGIFDALAAGVLDRDTFPYVVPPPEEGGDGGAPAAPAPQQAAAPSLFGGSGSAGGSLAAAGRSRSVRSSHSTAAAWASRAPGGGAGGGSFNAGGLGLGGGGGNGGNVSSASASSPTPSGRRVVVFIVGGVTRGEARAATAAASRTGLRCVVGGTGLLSGPWFVQALRELGSLDYSHEVE